MDFDLTDEQRLLKDSVDRLIADQYPFEQRKKDQAEPNGWSAAVWNQYAEIGLLGLPFEETLGGFGGGAVETALVMEAFGRGLVLEPYFATIILGGGLLRRVGSDAQRGALVPQITAGKLKLAFAHIERQSRYDLADVATTARRSGTAWILDGAKSVVLHGDCADKIFVTARVAGDRRGRDGVGLFLVDAASPGLTRRGYPTQDGLRAAEITLSGVRVEPENVVGENALPAIEHVIDEAIAALCAEAVGVMQVMHEATLEYLKTRKQFGRPIGSFQVLQHRSVDMLVALEQARSMAMFATVMAAEDDATERQRAIAAAKVQIGRSGRHIGQEAIQLHGGIGMTMEYHVGHHFKRITMIDQLYGDSDRHLATLARLGGLFGESGVTAVLLDLDGTLSDSRPGIAACFRYTVGELGHDPAAAGDLSWAVGPPIRVSIQRLIAHYGDDRVDRAVDIYRARYSAAGLYDCSVFPGVVDMLDQLRDLGLTMCIATSKRRDFAERVMDHLQLRPYVRAVYGAEPGGGLDDKQDLLAHILVTEQFAARDCVMLGDRLHDIHAARVNAIRSIGALWGYGGREELIAAGADALADQPGAVVQLLPR